MSEKPSHTIGWRTLIPAIACVFVLVASFLGIRNGSTHGLPLLESVREWSRSAVYISSWILGNVAATVLVGILLLHHHRSRLIAWIALALCTGRFVLQILDYYIIYPEQSEPGSLFFRVLVESSRGVAIITLIMLLLVPRLGRFGRYFQIAAVASTTTMFTFDSLSYLRILPSDILALDAIFYIAAIVGLISVSAVAYCAFFHRQIAPHAPPDDSATTISLTCPRCKTLQSIRSDGDRCPNCRLDIFIALREGRCRQCRYPLRGLTSDRCPECGTPIAVGTEVTRRE